jgi:hypothetical protein
VNLEIEFRPLSVITLKGRTVLKKHTCQDAAEDSIELDGWLDFSFAETNIRHDEQ